MQLRQELRSLTEAQWADIVSAEPKLTAMFSKAPRGRSTGSNFHAWVDSATKSDMKLASSACLFAQSVGNKANPPEGGISLLGAQVREPNIQALNDLAQSVVERYGYGPGVLFVLGAVVRFGRDSEVANHQHELMATVASAQPKSVDPRAALEGEAGKTAADPAREASEPDDGLDDASRQELSNSQGSARESKAGILSQADAGPPQLADAAVQPEALVERLDELEVSGLELAEEVVAWPDQLRAGQTVAAHTLELLTRWNEGLASAASQIVHLGGEIAGEGFAGMRRAIEDLRSASEAAVALRDAALAKIAELDEEINAQLAWIRKQEADLLLAPPRLRAQAEASITAFRADLSALEADRASLLDKLGDVGDTQATSTRRGSSEAGHGTTGSQDHPLGPPEDPADQANASSSEAHETVSAEVVGGDPRTEPRTTFGDTGQGGSDQTRIGETDRRAGNHSDEEDGVQVRAPGQGDLSAHSTLQPPETTTDSYESQDPNEAGHKSALHGEAVAIEPDAGDFGARYWLAASQHSSIPLVEALRLAVGAFAADGRGVEDLGPALDRARDRLGALDLEEISPDELTLLAAAAARASLSLGYTVPRADAELLERCGLGPEWRDALTAAFRASMTGYRHYGDDGSDQRIARRQQLADRAAEARASLTQGKTAYARASAVMAALGSPAGACGIALEAVERVAEGDTSSAPRLSEFLARVSDDRKINELIAEADRAAGHGRHQIVGKALAQMRSRVAEVRQLAVDAQGELSEIGRERSPNRFKSVRDDLLEHFKTLSPLAPDSPGRVAADRLRLWILDPVSTVGPPDSVEAALRIASHPLVGVDRGSDNLPVDSLLPSTADVAAAFAREQSPGALAQAYVERGNLELATEVLAVYGLPADHVREARSKLQLDVKRRVSEVQSSFERIRANRVLDDVTEAAISNQLEDLRHEPTDRFDLVLRNIADLDDKVQASRRQGVDKAAARLSGLDVATSEDRARVQALLDAGDLGLAGEYLLMLERGEHLPKTDDAAQPAELKQLMSLLASVSTTDSFDDLVDRVGGVANYLRAQSGTKAWRQLRQRDPGQSRLAADRMRDILRLLGLDPTTNPVDRTPPGRGRAGFRTWDVQARPVDGSIVPGLGSKAPRYIVTVFSEPRKLASQILEAISPEHKDAANLVLYPGTLSAERRRDLLMEARRRHITAIVIDDAVIALMAGHDGTATGSFRALQLMTLPFAAFEHYTPRVAGRVPDEVFVGRSAELHEILSPSGSLFVYGGRQLGKSALLRKAERQFNAANDHVAIYLDLKSHGIGEYNPTDHLWVVLAEELRGRGVIDTHVVKRESVVRKTREWLMADQARRIVLLLDESDLFLENEAREVDGPSGRVSRFANVGMLKALMEDTDRRFKPVIAGLHQVGRFSHISNTPLAHGGRDIPIGPLDRLAARDLVEKPLLALGYMFESPDDLWRFVGFANYQANLLQIACKGLVDHLQQRRPSTSEPPVLIRSRDVESVMADREVRGMIADRFNLTITLEDRYKVIALSMALTALSEGFGKQYDPADILADCRTFWPEGFDGMLSQDFRRYLQEMEGLGVLVLNHDERGTVAFRSPNVVSMLGSRSTVEEVLEEGSARFDLPRDYNPTATRRLVGGDGGTGGRSPFTEYELSELLPFKVDKESRLDVIVGSRATGVDLVGPVLQSVAVDRQSPITITGPEVWSESDATAGTGDQGGLPLMILRDASPASVRAAENLKSYCDNTLSHGFLVLVPQALEVIEAAGLDGCPMRGLSQWTDEALRSWDHPFAGRPERVALMEVTCGWPILVERAIEGASEGRRTGDVLEEAGNFPTGQAEALAFLDQAGLGGDRLRSVLETWLAYTGPGDHLDMDELDEIMDVHRSELDVMLRHLRLLGVINDEHAGWEIDPVIRRALAIAG